MRVGHRGSGEGIGATVLPVRRTNALPAVERRELRGPFEGKMLFQALADLVLVVHLAFIVFVLLGALLALRWPDVLWAHAPAAVWAVAIELGGWI